MLLEAVEAGAQLLKRDAANPSREGGGNTSAPGFGKNLAKLVAKYSEYVQKVECLDDLRDVEKRFGTIMEEAEEWMGLS